jgi:hypothetical protein
MTSKTMQVEVLIYKDVRGKELQYIRVTNEKKEEVLINVGEKTYNAVKELIEPKQPELPLAPGRIENGEEVHKPQTQEELKAKVLGNMGK